jgi:hypothetical protein
VKPIKINNTFKNKGRKEVDLFLPVKSKNEPESQSICLIPFPEAPAKESKLGLREIVKSLI